jgi:hypothetical protein
MKIHRFEVGPSIGTVVNDPFLNRYIIGVIADYHVTEIFARYIAGDSPHEIARWLHTIGAITASGDVRHIDLPEDDTGAEGLGNLADDRGGHEGAGPMHDDEIPFGRAGARVADDRFGREVSLGLEIVDSDGLEVKTA